MDKKVPFGVLLKRLKSIGKIKNQKFFKGAVFFIQDILIIVKLLLVNTYYQFFEHYNLAELSGCKRAKNLKQF